MATLSEYFETEARDALAEIDAALGNATPDAATLHRAFRALRGTAQLAREHRVARVAQLMESAAKSLLGGELDWSERLIADLRATTDDLRTLVRPTDDEDEQERRVAVCIERLRTGGTTADAAPAVPAAREPEPASDEFLRFAAQEVSGIVEALDRGIQQLSAAPMDRDPLKAVLRRQRSLLGAARLDDIPVVAEILRALEDLTRIVAKLDVGVKQDWLDVYRVGRDGLRSALESLQRNENPPATNSLSRLRTMRDELMERFGAGEAVSAAHTSGLVQVQSVTAPPQPIALPQENGPDAAAIDKPAPDEQILELGEEFIIEDEEAHGADDDGDVPDLLGAANSAMQRAAGAVPVESLFMTTDDALRQALALEDAIMRAVAHDPAGRAAAGELFDLIRHALG
jgi:chemotaxis protein histidine kinase CheA